MQRRPIHFDSKFRWLNAGLAVIAVTLWTGIGLVVIYPYNQKRIAAAFTPVHRPLAARDSDKSSDYLKRLIDGDKALQECLQKANPGDPLGLSPETPESAAQRKSCLDDHGAR